MDWECVVCRDDFNPSSGIEVVGILGTAELCSKECLLLWLAEYIFDRHKEACEGSDAA